MMEQIQTAAALIALVFVTVIVASSILAIWLQSPNVSEFLSLAELVLSWPVAAGGLVFGGGQAIVRAWKS